MIKTRSMRKPARLTDLEPSRRAGAFAIEPGRYRLSPAGVPRPCYLFKLKLTANVRRAIARVPWPADGLVSA